MSPRREVYIRNRGVTGPHLGGEGGVGAVAVEGPVLPSRNRCAEVRNWTVLGPLSSRMVTRACPCLPMVVNAPGDTKVAVKMRGACAAGSNVIGIATR